MNDVCRNCFLEAKAYIIQRDLLSSGKRHEGHQIVNNSRLDGVTFHRDCVKMIKVS